MAESDTVEDIKEKLRGLPLIGSFIPRPVDPTVVEIKQEEDDDESAPYPQDADTKISKSERNLTVPRLEKDFKITFREGRDDNGTFYQFDVDGDALKAISNDNDAQEAVGIAQLDYAIEIALKKGLTPLRVTINGGNETMINAIIARVEQYKAEGVAVRWFLGNKISGELRQKMENNDLYHDHGSRVGSVQPGLQPTIRYLNSRHAFTDQQRNKLVDVLRKAADAAIAKPKLAPGQEDTEEAQAKRAENQGRILQAFLPLALKKDAANDKEAERLKNRLLSVLEERRLDENHNELPATFEDIEKALENLLQHEEQTVVNLRRIIQALDHKEKKMLEKAKAKAQEELQRVQNELNTHKEAPTAQGGDSNREGVLTTKTTNEPSNPASSNPRKIYDLKQEEETLKERIADLDESLKETKETNRKHQEKLKLTLNRRYVLAERLRKLLGLKNVDLDKLLNEIHTNRNVNREVAVLTDQQITEMAKELKETYTPPSKAPSLSTQKTAKLSPTHLSTDEKNGAGREWLYHDNKRAIRELRNENGELMSAVASQGRAPYRQNVAGLATNGGKSTSIVHRRQKSLGSN